MKLSEVLLLIISSTGILGVSNNLAQGASLTSNVIVNNKIIGSLTANVPKPGLVNGLNNGIEIDFKTNANTSLPQLQSLLGIDHFNWFQIITLDTHPPLRANGQPPIVPYIDFPNGGYDYAPADNIPWYYNEKPYSGRICNIIFNCVSNLSNFTGSNFLRFIDSPKDDVGVKVNFDTFLIADFGNRTYDTLGGFSWSMQVDTNGISNIVSLDKGTTFLNTYAQEISHDFPGYTKVLRLPTYSFSNSLAPGKVNSFIKKGISPSESFVAWTDNLPRVNPLRKPDTILGTFDKSGQLIASNDDGGILGPNWGSGLTGYSNPDGTISMKVTGYPDFDFDGRINTSITRCSGGSGGGGCTTTNSYEPHNQSGKYKLYVKLDEDSFPSPVRNTISSSGMNLMNFSTEANNSPIQQRGIEESTTDYQEMSYLDPNDTAWWADNQEISYFDPNDTEWLADYWEMSYFDPNHPEWWSDNQSSESPISTPESTSALGLLALGAWGIIKAMKIRFDK